VETGELERPEGAAVPETGSEDPEVDGIPLVLGAIPFAFSLALFALPLLRLLRRKAVEEGMITLRGSGLLKVKDGLTTLEEVVRETVK